MKKTAALATVCVTLTVQTCGALVGRGGPGGPGSPVDSGGRPGGAAKAARRA